MSRLMTLSELYSLLLHIDTEAKVIPVTNAQPTSVLLNEHQPTFWVGARAAADHKRRPKSPRQVQVASQVMDMMGRFAESRGISVNDAWTEAAHHWIAQRQQDVQDLTTPTGRKLAHAVQQSWTTIDAQLAELRTR